MYRQVFVRPTDDVVLEICWSHSYTLPSNFPWNKESKPARILALLLQWRSSSKLKSSSLENQHSILKGHFNSDLATTADHEQCDEYSLPMVERISIYHQMILTSTVRNLDEVNIRLQVESDMNLVKSICTRCSSLTNMTVIICASCPSDVLKKGLEYISTFCPFLRSLLLCGDVAASIVPSIVDCAMAINCPSRIVQLENCFSIRIDDDRLSLRVDSSYHSTSLYEQLSTSMFSCTTHLHEYDGPVTSKNLLFLLRNSSTISILKASSMPIQSLLITLLEACQALTELYLPLIVITPARHSRTNFHAMLSNYCPHIRTVRSLTI